MPAFALALNCARRLLRPLPALLLLMLASTFASAFAADEPPAAGQPPGIGPPAAPVVPSAAPLAPLAPEKNICAEAAGPVALGSVQWNGWGRALDNTRYQPEPAIRAMDVPKLALKWAYGFQGGPAFGQPTVVDDRLFIAGSAGRIYALDAKTGCTYWTYDAAAASRTAIVIGELGQSRRAAVPKRLKRTLAHLDVIKAPSAAYFGDDAGFVYALDAQRGTLLWKTQVETHPLARIVGAPTVYNDRLYVAVSSTEETMAANPGYGCCTFRGSVAALDLASGRVLWKAFTVLEEPLPARRSAAGVQAFGPAGAAVSSSPTIDPKRGVLYVGTGASTTQLEQSLTDAIVAFDLNDGKLRWVKQLTVPGEVALSGFTSSPVLRTLAAGNQIIYAAQRSGLVYALDPDHGGEILWQTRLGLPDAQAPAAGAAVSAAAGAGPAPELAALSAAAGAVLHEGSGGIAGGPAADYRNLYVALSGQLAQPVNASGRLTALDLKTGIARWNTAAPQPACAWGETGCSHAQAQAVSVMPGCAFSGAMDGHLRAYSTIDGKILWDFDTAKAYQTQNGVRASGAALDLGGASIVNGTLYINSGNGLLAFSVGGK